MEKKSVDGSNFFILFHWDLKTEVFLKELKLYLGKNNLCSRVLESLANGFSHWNRLPMCQTDHGIFGLKNNSL